MPQPTEAEFIPETQRPTRVRHLVVSAAVLMSVLLYLDRYCVSIAAEYIREDLSLNQGQMGWFLSAFFWSYALAQVPSGWFSDRYGARIMLVIYILSWSFFTGAIGAVQSFAMLILMRLGCGITQAGAYPTSAALLSRWVPLTNRGFASSLVAFGGRAGGAIAPMLTALLMVLFVPLSVPGTFTDNTVLDPGSLAAKVAPSESLGEQRIVTGQTPVGERVWRSLEESLQRPIADLARSYRLSEADRAARAAAADPAEAAPAEELLIIPEQRAPLVTALNQQLSRSDLFDAGAFGNVRISPQAERLLRKQRAGESLSQPERERMNRLLLEAAFPAETGKIYVRGWRPVMYVYGLAGFAVAALFWFSFRERPEDHPGTNAAERELIAAGQPAPRATTAPPEKLPMAHLLTSANMWLVCIVQFGTNFGWVFLVTWLPRYLDNVHRIPLLQQGLMTAIPMIAGIVGMLAGGKWTDRLTGRLGIRWGRRLPMAATRFTAALGYGFCLVLGTTVGAGAGTEWVPWAYVAALSLVAFSTDLGTGAVWAFHQDVGGRYIGVILGWTNMFGNLGAAVAPKVYDRVLGTAPGLDDWNQMFAVCLAAFLLAGLCAFWTDATRPVIPHD